MSLFVAFSVLLILVLLFPSQAKGRSRGAVEGLRGVRIDGIGYEAHGRSAVIINGKLYHKGNKVGGFKIEEIRERDVILSDREGELYYVSVGGIKRAPLPKPKGIIDKIKKLTAGTKPKAKPKAKPEVKPEVKPEAKPEAEPEEKEQEKVEKKEGTLIGHVYVQGDKPGSIGNSEGIPVELVREGDPAPYKAVVDKENRFSITAPPGKYKLIIRHPGHKRYEKEVTVEAGSTRLVDPISLQNDLAGSLKEVV